MNISIKFTPRIIVMGIGWSWQPVSITTDGATILQVESLHWIIHLFPMVTAIIYCKKTRKKPAALTPLPVTGQSHVITL